jgi:hypothetical protein
MILDFDTPYHRLLCMFCSLEEFPLQPKSRL